VDRNEFTEKVLEAEGTLYRVAMSILKNDEDCADAVQEAILLAYGKLHTLREERYFKTWLCRILIRVCHRMARERKRLVRLEEYMEAAPAEETRCPDLYTAIMELDADLRLVVTLHYVEGFKTAEIARMLGVPEGTVKSRLSRARRALKSVLEEEVYDHAD